MRLRDTSLACPYEVHKCTCCAARSIVRIDFGKHNLPRMQFARLVHVRMGTIPEIKFAKSNPWVPTVEGLALALQVAVRRSRSAGPRTSGLFPNRWIYRRSQGSVRRVFRESIE